MVDIHQDHKKSDHYYAKTNHYLEFKNPAPFKEGDCYYETSLLDADGSINPGKAQSAVHHITEQEYQLILQAGFVNVLALPEQEKVAPQHPLTGLSEDQALFERPLVQQIVNRPFRDKAFAENVKTAYDKTCAFTGLRIINGGGRPEVQAAHIRPVAEHGPDSVRNGLALCGTVHWMFDRGLISLSDEHQILKIQEKIPEAIDRLLLPSGEMVLPNRQDYYPSPRYLQYHREYVFKG